MRVPSPTSLSVSAIGSAATAPTPPRARPITTSIVSRPTKGRAASCTSTTPTPGGSARRPARTESSRRAPPATSASRSPRSLSSHSGGRSAYAGGSATTTCRTSGWEVNGRSARSSIGTPRMARNCFGSPGPARTPAPAATMTTPTSGGEAAGELTDALQPDHVEIHVRRAGAGGQERTPEPLTRRLRETPLDPRDRPDLTAQSHLAEKEGVGGNGAVVDARDEGGQDRQVGRGLDEPHAAGDVDKDV